MHCIVCSPPKVKSPSVTICDPVHPLLTFSWSPVPLGTTVSLSVSMSFCLFLCLILFIALGQRRNKKEIKRYMETNENGNMTYQNSWDATPYSVAQLVGMWCHTPKGWGFDSWSLHVPKLLVRSLVVVRMGGNQFHLSRFPSYIFFFLLQILVAYFLKI